MEAMSLVCTPHIFLQCTLLCSNVINKDEGYSSVILGVQQMCIRDRCTAYRLVLYITQRTVMLLTSQLSYFSCLCSLLFYYSSRKLQNLMYDTLSSSFTEISLMSNIFMQTEHVHLTLSYRHVEVLEPFNKCCQLSYSTGIIIKLCS